MAFTTLITRRTLPEHAWARGIAAFTVLFAAGQVAGPLLTGLLADRAGGLRLGLGVSAVVLLLGAALAWGQGRTDDLNSPPGTRPYNSFSQVIHMRSTR